MQGRADNTDTLIPEIPGDFDFSPNLCCDTDLDATDFQQCQQMGCIFGKNRLHPLCSDCRVSYTTDYPNPQSPQVIPLFDIFGDCLGKGNPLEMCDRCRYLNQVRPIAQDRYP